MDADLRTVASIAVPTVDAETGQYLIFVLDGEEYGVNILRVQEIKGWDTVTEIPNTPAYLRGVINLRGTIVPIIDLRLRFQMEPVAYGKTTVVIVLKVNSSGAERTVGFVVDAVSDVCNVPGDELRSPPDFGVSVRIEFVRALATVADKMIILLDIDKLIDADEVPADRVIAHG